MPPTLALDHKKLIKLVEKYPVLYNTEDERYMDVEFKSTLWEKIAAELEVTSAMCKTRWYNIRDMYRKSILRNKNREKPTQYRYAAQLKFLQRYYAKTDKSLSEADEGEDPDESEKEELEDRKDFLVENANTVTIEPVIPHSFSEEKSVEVVPSVVYTSAMHPVDAFLVSLASTLKQLSPRDLSQAKLELFQVAHKFEMRSLAERQKGARDPIDVTWMQE